ncbi:MAG: ATP-binding protein [Bacteroidales bacterium]
MNPFTLTYHPDYFCDRQKEMTRLKDNLSNGLNSLVHSPRRLGKSALIRHLFHSIEDIKEYDTIYIDLFATKNMEDLIRTFAESILGKYYKKSILNGIKELLKGVTPTLSFSQDGTPVLSLSLKEGQVETSLGQLFKYLEDRNKKVIVAFDEFQEVANYPEKAEALLRSYIQKLLNVKFIFSGSSNHILQNMFYSAARPFYQSSEVIILDKIDYDKYFQFIELCFLENSKQIDKEAIDHILEFTETYTYYTQVICNQAFFRTENKLQLDEAIEITTSYIENRKIDYMGIYNLLPDNHKKVVVAVAKEGIVQKPSSIELLMKYKLPSSSSTIQSINALATKEIIYRRQEGYVVYDVFFKRFLERYF